jgi:hypothetical protein
MHDERTAWHISDILSVVTGWPIPPSGFVAIGTLQEYLAQRPLSAADMLFYDREFRYALLEQYQGLAAYADDMPMPEELVAEWLRRRTAEFGEYLLVRRLPPTHPACMRVIWPAEERVAE